MIKYNNNNDDNNNNKTVTVFSIHLEHQGSDTRARTQKKPTGVFWVNPL